MGSQGIRSIRTRTHPRRRESSDGFRPKAVIMVLCDSVLSSSLDTPSGTSVGRQRWMSPVPLLSFPTRLWGENLGNMGKFETPEMLIKRAPPGKGLAQKKTGPAASDTATQYSTAAYTDHPPPPAADLSAPNAGRPPPPPGGRVHLNICALLRPLTNAHDCICKNLGTKLDPHRRSRARPAPPPRGRTMPARLPREAPPLPVDPAAPAVCRPCPLLERPTPHLGSHMAARCPPEYNPSAGSPPAGRDARFFKG